MKQHTFIVSNYDGDSQIVRVEFEKTVHWDDRGDRMTAYDVFLIEGDDRRKIGTIERSIQSTDRIYGRIRSPGKGRPAWQWYGPNPGDRSNLDGARASRPGIHEPNRASAVACLLGFSYGRKT